MTTRSRTPELNSFDLIWAVTQDAVNTQLKWLFTFGDIQSTVVVGDPEAEGFKLEAQLLAPALIFDSAQEGHAAMVVGIASGTLTTWSGFGPRAKPVEHDCKGWQIGFDVRLNLAGLDALKPPAATIRDKLERGGFMDSRRFSVRGLFLDFQNTNFSSFDENRTVVLLPGEEVSEVARIKTMFYTGIRAHFESIKTSDNPYALGYTAQDATPQAQLAQTLFAPTGVVYSTHRYRDPAGPAEKKYLGRSTLNFMMMTEHVAPSTDPRDGHFERNLVQESGVDGTALIRQELFVGQYLKPVWDRIVEALHPGRPLVALRSGGVPAITNATLLNGFSLSESIASSDDLGDYVRPFYTQTKNLTMLLVNAADHIELRGSGTMFSELLVKQYAWPNTYLGQWWGKSSTHLDFCIKFLAGADGKIQICPEFTFTPQPLDRGHSGAWGALSSVLDSLGLVANMQALLGQASEATQDLTRRTFTEQMGRGFDALAARVVLPGAKEFFYRKLQLTPEGNIQLYLTCKPEDA